MDEEIKDPLIDKLNAELEENLGLPEEPNEGDEVTEENYYN